MEEELHYSTVVFKKDSRPSKEAKEDESTIYSAVKPAKTVSKADGEAAAQPQHLFLLAVCLGILCVLMLVSIGVIIYQNQQLILESSDLETEVTSLTETLDHILNFTCFPVDAYCPQKQCQPCQKNWIQFEGKCYLFYNKNAPWKTWTESQQYCQSRASNLVVIENLLEQEFISNHTTYYYDSDHGYWLGLNQTADQSWLWVDGRNDTLGYWMKQQHGTPGPCALMIPEETPTASWDQADCKFENKFICESKVMTWPNN